MDIERFCNVFSTLNLHFAMLQFNVSVGSTFQHLCAVWNICNFNIIKISKLVSKFVHNDVVYNVKYDIFENVTCYWTSS